jgi:hypothetical protein
VEAEKILEHQIVEQRTLPLAQQAATDPAKTEQLAGVTTKKPAVNKRMVAGVLGYDPSKAAALEKREWQKLEAESKF